MPLTLHFSVTKHAWSNIISFCRKTVSPLAIFSNEPGLGRKLQHGHRKFYYDHNNWEGELDNENTGEAFLPVSIDYSRRPYEKGWQEQWGTKTDIFSWAKIMTETETERGRQGNLCFTIHYKWHWDFLYQSEININRNGQEINDRIDCGKGVCFCCVYISKVAWMLYLVPDPVSSD